MVTTAQTPSSTSSPAQPSPAQRPRRVFEAAVPEADINNDDVLRIDADLVTVETTVLDAGGQMVRNLTAQDFKIYEDGVERPLAFFNVEARSTTTRPTAIVFAIDISGSVTGEEIERLRGAMNVFTRRLVERPSVFAVMSFGMTAKVLQGFTSDTKKINEALVRLAREPNGMSTHTYDAVDDAIRLLERRAPRTRERRLMKRAVVVVTDGFPVGDRVHPRTVIERANAADVSVYTMTLPSYSQFRPSRAHAPLPTPLDVSGLVERTGGSNVYATDQNFDPLFRRLAEEVSAAYVLAFYPSDAKRRDGRTHTIRVEVPPGCYVRQSRSSYRNEVGK